MFVGRSAQLAQLAQCAAEVNSGRPQVVLIEGEAGVGKSALVREWLADAGWKRSAMLRASCDVVERDFAFGVIGQLIRTVPQAMRQEFSLLLDDPPAGAAPFQVGAQLLALLDSLRDTGPVIAVVDDIQWADQESLKALGFVLRRLEADPVLTVLIARVGKPDQTLLEVRRLVGRLGSRPLVLGGLNTEEVAQFACGVTGHAVVGDVAGRLQAQTGGNPLYLQTLLTEASAEDLRQQTWPVPSSLSQAVIGQLAMLGGPGRSLVEAAAVLDTRHPLALVAQVAGVAGASAALDPGLAAGLLRWWPNEPAAPVVIGHALQRDAVIAAMAPGQRRALHARAAQVVDRAAAWRHRVAATGGVDPRLAAELEDEAEQLLGTGAVERAATMLLWAANLVAVRTEHERLLLTAAAHLMATDHFARVQTLVSTARSCAPGPLRDLVLGSWACSRGDTGNGRRILLQVLEAAAMNKADYWIAVLAGRWLGTVGVVQGDGELTETACRQALGLQPGSITDRLKGELSLGRGMTAGPVAGLQELARLAPLQDAQALHAQDSNASLLLYRGLLRAYAGRLCASVEDLTAVLRMAERNRIAALLEFVHTTLAINYYLLGNWKDSILHAERAITIADTEDKPLARVGALSVASWVSAGRGEWQRTEELLKSAEQEAKAFPPGFFGTFYWTVAKAMCAQARGDAAAMTAALADVPKTPCRGQAVGKALYWKPLQVEALIGYGRLDTASQALAQLQDLARDLPSLRTVTAWLTGQLAEATGDVRRAAECYAEELTLPCAPDDIPLHRARLEHAYGRLLADIESPGQAETWLCRAAERFASLGAYPFLDRCQAEANSLGALLKRSPRRPDHQLRRLTGREMDIAHLVARGLTNREVATELFVSAKTVEYHLGNVYHKLALANRRQLRDYVQKDAAAMT